MLRNFLLVLTAMATLPVALARADTSSKPADSKDHSFQAKLTKVDPQKDMISVKVMDKNGKEQDKSLQLTKDTKVFDTAGQATQLSSLRAGEDVTITRHGGQVAEVRQDAEATISHFDAKTGTVTVKYPDQNGKEVQRTFHLVADSVYLDSNGHVAAEDVFRSGDVVLFVEADGNIRMMKKSAKQPATTARKENSAHK